MAKNAHREALARAGLYFDRARRHLDAADALLDTSENVDEPARAKLHEAAAARYLEGRESRITGQAMLDVLKKLI